MFGLLSGGSFKWIITGLAVLVIVSAIGGYFLYQKSIVEGLQETITSQQLQIATLTIDNEKLKVSNQSLEKEIIRRVDESKEIRTELDNLRKSDSTSRNRLATIQKQLNDYERKSRIDRIRGSTTASLLLRYINKDIKCYIENFDRFDGKCILGKWVKDGERFDGKEVTPEGGENE